MGSQQARCRVLIVDDDPAFRAQVVREIAARGHEVWEAAGGAEATELLARCRPDAVLVDGVLPDTDGVRWIAELRRDSPDLPVAFVTAHLRDDRSSATLRQLGVREILEKPIAGAVVAEIVGRLLGGEGPRAAPESAAYARLRERYARALPGHLAAVAAALEAIAGAPGAPELRVRAYVLAHTVAGTAGTFGYEEVGALAVELQDAACADGPFDAAGWLGRWRDLQRAVSQGGG